MTLLFLTLAAVYFVVVFFVRNKRSTISFQRKTNREELAPIISNFLFHKEQDPIDDQKHYVELKIKIRAHLKKRGFRKVLAELLVNLQKDVSGTTRQSLLNLYRDFGLHHVALEQLKSWRWQVVSKNILELTEMEVQEACPILTRFLTDKRSVVRKQAQISMVTMRNDGMAHVLDMARHPISEWQQLKLIEALEKKEAYQPPKFKSWLLSANKHVVFLALRLIHHYGQNDAEPALFELVKHKDATIKIAALECIKAFGFRSGQELLKTVFCGATVAVKIAILDIFASNGTKEDLPFLQKTRVEEEDFLVQSKFMAAINSIAPDTVLPTQDIEDVKPDTNEVLIKPPETDAIPDNTLEERSGGIIEVEEVEVYDTIEPGLPKAKPNTENTKLDGAVAQGHSTKVLNIDFELGALDHKSANSLDTYLGLVETEQEDGYAKSDVKIAFEQEYLNMDTEKREQVLFSLMQKVGEDELQKLEAIVDVETNSEIRFSAFRKLKSLRLAPSSAEKPSKKSSALFPKYHESPFFELFEMAGDTNSKYMLLCEIETMGDAKEVAFLRHIIKTLDGKLKSRAAASLEAILKRLENVAEQQKPQVALDFTKATKSEARTRENIPMTIVANNVKETFTPAYEPSLEPDFALFEISRPLKQKVHHA